MGLSYNANWGTFQLQNPDMGNVLIPVELAPPPLPLDHQLFTLHDNFSIHDTCIDPLLDPPPLPLPLPLPLPCPLYDEQSLLFNQANFPEIFPGLLDSSSSDYGHPKRQKTTYDDYLGGMFDGDFLPMMNEQLFLPEIPLEMLIPPLLDYPLPEVYDCGSSSTTTSTNSTSCVGANGKMKAQSIAARVRRKKISEKTEELGKLIPGGHKHKMNSTAEMFESASKYIKFLQAQLGVVQTLLPSMQENEGALELFRGLLTSPLVQEKMYMADKCLCLVPKKMIETSLKNDHQLQSKPQLFKQLIN